MKTLTEFSGFVLKEAMSKKAALLTEGKTEEEALAAIHEQLKLDEAKIGFYKNVVDMTSSRVDRVKRVVVALKATEAEKVPESYIEREGHFYLVEYFPSQDGRSASQGYRDDRNDRGRGGRGGRGGNDRGRGGDRGRGNDRGNDRGRDRPLGPSAPREDRKPSEGAFVSRPAGERPARPARPARPPRDPNAPRPERVARPPRDPNAPKPQRAARPPRGPKGAGELRLVLKGQSQTTLQGSGVETAAPAAAPSSEAPQA